MFSRIWDSEKFLINRIECDVATADKIKNSLEEYPICNPKVLIVYVMSYTYTSYDMFEFFANRFPCISFDIYCKDQTEIYNREIQSNIKTKYMHSLDLTNVNIIHIGKIKPKYDFIYHIDSSTSMICNIDEFINRFLRDYQTSANKIFTQKLVDTTLIFSTRYKHEFLYLSKNKALLCIMTTAFEEPDDTFNNRVVTPYNNSGSNANDNVDIVANDSNDDSDASHSDNNNNSDDNSDDNSDASDSKPVDANGELYTIYINNNERTIRLWSARSYTPRDITSLIDIYKSESLARESSYLGCIMLLAIFVICISKYIAIQNQ